MSSITLVRFFESDDLTVAAAESLRRLFRSMLHAARILLVPPPPQLPTGHDENVATSHALIEAPLLETEGLGAGAGDSAAAKPRASVRSGLAPISCGAQAPGMVVSTGVPYLVPPQSPDHHGMYTVVLDLDETLIFARGGGTVQHRPGLAELLEFLHGRCEVIVWTAGVRRYAQGVLAAIDPAGVVQHCVYRHSKWCAEDASLVYNKDLTFLGRDLARTIILDNTPECCVDQPDNAIICSSFSGDDSADRTLLQFRRLLEELFEDGSDVADFVSAHPGLWSWELNNPVLPELCGVTMHCLVHDSETPAGEAPPLAPPPPIAVSSVA